jgi:translation initiation factor eIF-2B subunit delta
MDESNNDGKVIETKGETKGGKQQQGQGQKVIKEKQQKPQQQNQQQQGQGQGQKAIKETQQNQQQSDKIIDKNNLSKDKLKTTTPSIINDNVPSNVKLSCFDHLIRKPLDPNLYADVLLHPATVELGLLYKNGYIHEDDDRCSALIVAFCKIIQDYNLPLDKNIGRDLDKHISKQFDYLVHCRQHSIGMGNIIKYLRFIISNIDPELSELLAKEYIINSLQTFFDERISYARRSIATYFTSAIRDGDVVLTFGSSSLIRYILKVASLTKQFRLIVVDTRPLNEGLKTLSCLSSTVRCIYTPLSGTAAAMRNATRVILGIYKIFDILKINTNIFLITKKIFIIGASALFSNGSVLAPSGTAMVAALAKAQRVPVIFAAESYKFSEKVQLDSIVYNELGNSNELIGILSYYHYHYYHPF